MFYIIPKKKRAIAITKEAKTLLQSISIHLTPLFPNKCSY